MLFALAALYGKDYGESFLLSVMPMYSLFYLMSYRVLCSGFENETRRAISFGIMARGTFVGATYYLSIWLFLVIALLFITAAI